MDVSKFIIDGNEVNVKDAEARSELASQSGSISEIQSEIDSQSVAISELGSKVDELYTNKQNVLSHITNFSGNIDELYATSQNTIQNNGVYFCQTDAVTGTLPFTITSNVYFFTLIVLRNIQIAIPYVKPADSTANITVKIRDITNGWRLWRGATFTV